MSGWVTRTKMAHVSELAVVSKLPTMKAKSCLRVSKSVVMDEMGQTCDKKRT